MFQQMQQTFEVGVNAMKNDYHISEASYLSEIESQLLSETEKNDLVY